MPQTFIIGKTYKEIYLGQLGWHPTCKTCKETDPMQWIEWKDEFPYKNIDDNSCQNYSSLQPTIDVNFIFLIFIWIDYPSV